MTKSAPGVRHGIVAGCAAIAVAVAASAVWLWVGSATRIVSRGFGGPFDLLDDIAVLVALDGILACVLVECVGRKAYWWVFLPMTFPFFLALLVHRMLLIPLNREDAYVAWMLCTLAVNWTIAVFSYSRLRRPRQPLWETGQRSVHMAAVVILGGLRPSIGMSWFLTRQSSEPPPLAFDRARWLQPFDIEDPSNVRYRMRESAVAAIKPGMDVAAVERILGRPTQVIDNWISRDPSIFGPFDDGNSFAKEVTVMRYDIEKDSSDYEPEISSICIVIDRRGVTSEVLEDPRDVSSN